MKALLVFPHQLFIKTEKNTTLIFLEDKHFFDEGFRYHKHKLMLHRASMKLAYDSLDCDKAYYEHPFDFNSLFTYLKSFEQIYAYDPINHDIQKRYALLNIKWLETPNFMTKREIITKYFDNKDKYYMKDFYVFQRKRLNLLMDKEKPLGGKYSFDTDNRKKLPKHIEIPKPIILEKSLYVIEAAQWVDTNFKQNPGFTDTFNHPISRKQALMQMEYFFKHKFYLFGPYEDALSSRDPYLFHSNLSSSLNIGLLSPQEIVSKAIEQESPIESKEGFIRQIIGWREFMRAVYLLDGEHMKKMNVLNHHQTLSEVWYKATTKIPIVDQVIDKLNTHAYAHHIERLMVLGNVMMLSNIDPNEVYHYFMSMFIDAYEWVMVPNIYGMSQFAAGDLMTTKPYFSGSNYLLKMGVSSGEWTNIWDALFYQFITEHRSLIERNPRLSLLTRLLDQQSQEAKDVHKKIKSEFITLVTK